MTKFILKDIHTANEFIDMYTQAVPESCMSLRGSSGYMGQFGDRLWQERGIWPSVLYSHIPGVMGLTLNAIYDTGNEMVLGRGFALAANDKWQISALGLYIAHDRSTLLKNFAPVEGTIDRWHSFLVDKYVTLIKADTRFGLDDVRNEIEMPTFEFPAIRFEGKLATPLPHMDFIQKPFWITYQPDKKSFLFSANNPGKAHHSISSMLCVESTYNYSLYVGVEEGSIIIYDL